MTPAIDIPREALDVRYNSDGFLPHVGLHHRRGIFYQESSYSHFWFAGVMLAIAVVVLMLPWETRAVAGKLKYWVAAICVWGGICCLIPYFFRKSFGPVITIDPKSKTVGIVRGDFREKLSWDQIVGLQVCHQKVSGDSEMNGYQLNLVWVDAGGTVKRHCLLKHSIRSFVVRLGKRYESLFWVPAHGPHAE